MIIWLASFPCSGVACLRVALNRAYGIKTCRISNGDAGVPEDENTSPGAVLLTDDFDIEAARRSSNQYWIETHKGPPDEDDRAIYLVRDGREATLDCLQSLRKTHDQKIRLIEVIFSNSALGTWGQHIDCWKPESRPHTLLVQYEELTSHPDDCIRKIAEFSGISPARDIPQADELAIATGTESSECESYGTGRSGYSESELLAFWIVNYRQMREYGYAREVPQPIAGLASADKKPASVSEHAGVFYSIAEHFHSILEDCGRRVGQLHESLDQKVDDINCLKLREKELAKKLWQFRQHPGYRLARKIVSPYARIKNLKMQTRSAASGSGLHSGTPRACSQAGINLGRQLADYYGDHRSGWSYAICSLAPLHNEHAIYLDTFIERTFCWTPEGPRSIKVPWIGVIHVPPNIPEWFQHEQSNEAIFASRVWQESLPFCKGLFTLSKYHKTALGKKLDIPLCSLIHPTEIPEKAWSWERFERNTDKKIIQVGWWLRRMHAIFELPASDYRKVFLRVTEDKYLEDLFSQEARILTSRGEFRESMYQSADIVGYLPDDVYDSWLSENICFLYLYDASANNAVLECIARGTPLLVNPIEPVIEYLGEDYPFYYSRLEEAVEKVADDELIRTTHDYLMNHSIRKKLTGGYFRKSVAESSLVSGDGFQRDLP